MSNTKSKALKSPNRGSIRVTMASRLMAGFYDQNKRNLKGSSVIGCGRWKAYGRDSSTAEIRIDQDGARFDGHFICGNVWTCDRCARARVSQSRSWIRAAFIPSLELHKLSAAMMTFTMTHTYDGNWKESIDRLHDAYKLFDKNMSRHYKTIGSFGKLKSLEAPVGKNGIHGHFHVLLTYVTGVDMSDFKVTARREWDKAVKKVGGECNEHGFDLKLNAAADYLAKHDLAHEMSSHDTKMARQKGSSLSQLLDRAALGDKKSSAEWLRAIEALEGRRRFHAGDIASKLGIPTCSEWEDEEHQAELMEHNANAPEPVKITYPLRDHLRATAIDHPRFGLALILRAARGGDAEKVWSIVKKLCDEYDAFRLSQAITPEQKIEERLFAEVGKDLNFD